MGPKSFTRLQSVKCVSRHNQLEWHLSPNPMKFYPLCVSYKKHILRKRTFIPIWHYICIYIYIKTYHPTQSLNLLNPSILYTIKYIIFITLVYMYTYGVSTLYGTRFDISRFLLLATKHRCHYDGLSLSIYRSIAICGITDRKWHYWVTLFSWLNLLLC